MRKKKKLTDKAVASLKTTGVRYEAWDKSKSGFGVRVGSSGTKSFVYVYRFDDQPRRITLGRYPRMSLADAGVAYAEAQRKVAHGIDPGASEVEQRRRLREAPTVRELGLEYIERHCKPNKRSWEEDLRVLNHDVLPAWGSRKVSSVARADVNALLDDIAARAPIQANRTFAFVRSMFRFAETRDYVVASPCHGVRARTKERTRDRVLEPDEISSLWLAVERPGITETLRLAIRFLLLTAQRIGEVTNVEWSEIDFKQSVWVQPAAKVKNGKPHRVPLSRQALAILKQARQIAVERQTRIAEQRGDANTTELEPRWVFPSPRGDNPITTRSLDRALRRFRVKGTVPDFRPHDLRRTAATHMTRLGVDRLTVHKLLNHSDRSVTAIYDRYDREEEKRNAVKIWGREVYSLVANVSNKAGRRRASNPQVNKSAALRDASHMARATTVLQN